MRVLLSTILCLSTSIASAQDAAVALRGGAGEVRGQLTLVDADGVRVTTPDKAVVWIGWDSVADAGVQGAEFAEVSERAWRARIRVDRGDYVAAEPLLEALLPAYAGRRGPTSAVVAWGLMRCRLWRGAYAGAVAPMITYAGAVGSGRDGWYLPARSSGEPRQDERPDGLLWDEASGLSPLLPPMWVNVPATGALARERWVRPAGRAGTLSMLYEQAARFDAGMDATLPEPPTGDDGVRLVYDIVASCLGDADQRRAARAALRARLRSEPPVWMQTWVHAAVGRSLVREADTDSRLLGIASLLQVPARAEREGPYLTGVCLAEAAVALRALGDGNGASAIRGELESRFPRHPVIGWAELEKIPSLRREAPAEAVPAPAPESQATPQPLTAPGESPPDSTPGGPL